MRGNSPSTGRSYRTAWPSDAPVPVYTSNANDSGVMKSSHEPPPEHPTPLRPRSWVSQRIVVGDPLNPFVAEHDRHYQFTWLAVLGREFAEELAGAFARFTSSYAPASGKAQKKAIGSLLRWLITHRTEHPELVGQLGTSNWHAVPEAAWHAVLHQWHAFYVDAARPGANTKGQKIHLINTVWKGLNRRGIVPELTLRPPKNYRRNVRAKRTLAEVATDPPSSRDEEAISALLERLPAEDRKSPQTRDFLSVLLSELGEIPNSPTKLADEVSRILKERLAVLRSVFETALLEDYRRFCTAEAMVVGNQTRFAELAEAFTRTERGDLPRGVWNQERGAAINALLRDPGETAGLANWLGFVDGVLGGVPYRYWEAEGGDEFRRICARFGGVLAVHHHLNASGQTLVAALGLILIDTGFNVASVLETDEPGSCTSK